jgi:hypothetical protein
MTFKIFCGWVLLFAGVAIICSTLYFTYNIFTAKSDIPEFFNVAEIEEKKNLPVLPDLSKGTQGMDPEVQQEIMSRMVGEQINAIFPTAFLATLFNLIAWSIFAGIAIFGGGQLAGLGIRLIKTI